MRAAVVAAFVAGFLLAVLPAAFVTRVLAATLPLGGAVLRGDTAYAVALALCAGVAVAVCRAARP